MTEKKISAKACKKNVLLNANYARVKNDCTNAFRPRRFKWCDFSANFIGYCSIC